MTQEAESHAWWTTAIGSEGNSCCLVFSHEIQKFLFSVAQIKNAFVDLD